MLSDYYEILELTSTANATQIKAAYKRLAMQYHPDRNMGDKQAEEMFKRINEAYHILSDPLKKSRYDLRFESKRPAYAEDHIQREYNRRRYYQTHQPRTSYYEVDKNYFKIQGLAILVFFMFAGLAFGTAHTVMYFVEKGQMEEWVATTKRLKQVNGLFEAGRFNEAFDMVSTYKQQYPTEFRFTYAKDSLITALGRIAESTYEQGDYKKAVEHLLVLRELQNPVRENTLKKIAWCQFYLGNYDEALRAWKHLYNQKPENFELVYLIGMVNLEKLGNKEEALQYFDLGKDMFKKNLTQVYGEAFEIVMDPMDAPDIYYDLFIGRAKVNIELQHYQDAIKDGNWAIYLRRTKPEGYYLRAMAKINARTSSDLCDDIRQARQLGSQEATELQKKYCH